MRSRSLILLGLILLLLGGGLWWRSATRPAGPAESPVASNAESEGVRGRPITRAATIHEETISESTAPLLFGSASSSNALASDPVAYRLANTPKTSGQLLRDDRAILLENALIDARQPVGFQIPEHLKLQGEPGSYIVQARGPIDAAFRAAVTAAGAEYVSYIPNNAWLVRGSAAVAERLQASPMTQTVLPWEPVYKLKSELLGLALKDQALPPDAKLNLLVYADAQAEVLAQLQELGVTRIATDASPFGTIVTVQPNEDWTALALLPGVQIVERAYPRARANDLTRVRLGVATNAVTTTNYLGLTGTNVLVSVNDSGVDAEHPDFEASRLFALNAAALTDDHGHGTHVAGIIAGSGLASTNVVAARGSLNPGTNGQYRGVAPGANLFVQVNGFGFGMVADRTLQENVARTNALISNNSWNYVGNSTYSLAAASYDAAVRDSLPEVPGSQSVLYVFSAGNAGNGSDSGQSGSPGSVLSPATAKNVLSVGAIELARDITNEVERVTGSTTNKTTPWKGQTSSDNQVAAFSGRGNVGIQIEGDFGRYKPDVMAPGTFVIAPRSTTWDEEAYYNPTNRRAVRLRDQVVEPGGFNVYSIFLPQNAVGFTINLVGNFDSPVPFPDLPIFVRRDGVPTPATFDLRRTNSVAVPPDLGGVGTFVGQNWSYGIANPTGIDVSFDILTEVITTNDLGNYFQVLSNLNNSLSGTNDDRSHYYRYESGTSMAAAAASGTLALLQEFFEQRLNVTNSPALMKALLINGARSVGNLYDFNVRSSINYQGWGLVRLENSLPAGISNAFNWAAPGAIKLLDQSPTNALATGQSRTRVLQLEDVARTLPLRITLAWTDPPGNPAAGVKLVNDLDLVVTNLDTGEVFLGNDIQASSVTGIPWDTNEPPNFDAVNNVENVYLSPVLGSNYAVTVVARRVNVNAVTAHTNNVVQDYALVVSSGNGEATNAVTLLTETAIVGTEPPEVVFMTNSIVQPDFATAFLQNQRVGANAPLLGTTNGITNQWKFYVVTNTTTFTNAAFLVSQQTDLAPHRMGIFANRPDEATRRFADIDMYVTVGNPNLTNLVPAVLDASFKSLSRNDLSGDELIIFADSAQNQIYYIGVKSEDHMAAQYEFFAIFSLLPLGQEDANGFVRAYPMISYEIPDGSPGRPGGTRFLAVPRPGINETVRRVVITNNVSHENYGDIVAAVDHNSRAVIFDNHRSLESPPYPLPPGPYEFLYDDSGEGDFPTAIPPDGPGSFDTFIGEAPGGTWYFTYSDDALTQVGIVSNVMIRVDRQCEDDCIITNDIAPNSWRYFSRNVPIEATNLMVCVTNITTSNPGPLQLYVRQGARPTTNLYDFRLIIDPGGCLTIDKSTLPPLQGGRYFIGVFNPNPTQQAFTYQSIVLIGAPPIPTLFSGNTGAVPLLDDAVTNYTQFITNDAVIGRLDVGLRIDHPRVSDLAVTLVSPRGTRVLLVENRGGTTTNGFGSSLTVTNIVPVATNGGPAAVTNVIPVGATAGTFTVDYNFFCAPDRMLILYEGTPIFDTGVTNNGCPSTAAVPRREVITFGPGASTDITVIMNPGGNTETNTVWEYNIGSINQIHDYLIFTDNTNKTTTPIKFATPPFVGSAGTTTMLSDFELPVAVGDYIAPTLGLPNGWDVMSNQVSVVNDPQNAQAGSRFMALARGSINRLIPTTAGQDYVLTYWYRGPGAVGWWRAEGNGVDQIYGHNGAVESGTTFAAGQVGQAFNFASGNARKVSIPDQPVFQLTNSLTIEGWIRPTGPGILILWRGDRRSGYDPYYMQMEGDNNLRFSILTDAGPIGGTADFVRTPLIYNQWWHVVGMLDGNAGTISIYTNGALAAQKLTAIRPFASLMAGQEPVIGIGNVGTHEGFNIPFTGSIDEISLYSRALSASEIKAIYNAGASGKFDPLTAGASGLAKGRAVLGGITNVFLGNNTNWQSETIVFTAVSNGTPFEITGLQPGMLIDSVTLLESGSSRYVLPEESLKAFEGENAFGEWQLEIIDTRTGASNNVALLDWQLQFVFQTESPLTGILTPGVPNTRTVCAGKIDYFAVDVPTFARFATNWLISATGPLNVYYNQSIRPTGTNVAPADFDLLIGQTNGLVTLTTNVPAPAGLPVLNPGQRYYLGIENPSTNDCVTYTFLLDFDLVDFPPVVELTNGVPYCRVNPGPAGVIDYYAFNVSTNAVRAQFELFNLSGDLTLLLRRGLPPTFNVFDYLSANVFTNDEVITVFDFSQPVALTPGEWYLGAANVFGPAVSYCVKATEWPVYGTNIVVTNTFVATNSFCLTWTSLPGVRYYVEGLTDLTSTNWAVVSPTIVATDYATTWCLALPSPFHFFRVREGQPLNTYVPPPVISSIRRTFFGIELTWGGPVTAQYQVEWSPTLVPAVWSAFENPPGTPIVVTSTTGLFNFLDDGTLTVPAGFGVTRYYRLVLLP